MFELQILKVQSPSNFWGRIVNGSEILAESSEYTKLHEAMNLFYHQVWKNGDKLKMESFEPGQVCIVYSKKIKSWCRAFIDSHHHESNGHHVMCFLLDYADYVIVEKKHIQAAIKKFMHLPYWAKKFRLAGLQPSRLTVDLYRDKAEMVPASQWDNAAVRYFQNLVQESSLTEAELYTTMNDYYIIYLYVLQGTEKICVNDDLATKGFACYTSSVLGSNPFLATQNVDWKYFCKHQEKWSAVEVLWPGALKRTENQTCRQDLPGCATSSKHLVDSCERKMVMARIKEQFDEEKSSSENQKKEPLQFNLRLLRFLDPYPAKDISLPEVSVLSDCNCNALIHSASKINACSHLDMSPIPENLKKILRKKKYKGPNFEESYTWPAIIRGCDVVAISHKGNDPMLFIPPLLRFLQYSSIYTSPSLHGPAAVILCPSWRKARHVFTLLEEFKSAESLSPMLLLFGLKTDKAEHLKILKECMVIVTTPNCLVRLLQFQCHRLVGYCHLILDEVDELFSQAFEQISLILDLYKKAIDSEERRSLPQQIIAVGKKWNKKFQKLVVDYMTDPFLLMTLTEEAVLYANVQQVVLLSLDCDKIPHLIDSLDFNPELPQKTLIFTNSSEEADHVFKVVRNSSLFSMKIHENLTHQIDFVKNQWKKVIGPGTHVILVLTNDFIKALDITDATCVVHFGFPVSPQLFGARQFCMKDYFQNLTEMAKMEQESNKAKSILLLTDKNASHIGGVLQYLERTEAVLPPTMKSFADGVWKAKEFQKRSKPLCKHLKTSGFCKNWQICPERHALFPTLDVPLYPQSNTVSILPLYIENASCYFGRIVQGMEDPYEVLSAAMSEYYKSNKDNPKTVEVGMLYGIQEETIFNRVQVLEVYEKEEGIFQQVTIKYIDDGRIKQVQAHNLLNLPSKFQSLHFQAVEIILYGVKPLDNETEWDSMVSTYINKKIRGKLHEADVVLCLGNTIWIDKMVLVTKIPDTKVLINEHVVQSEIIATGLGEKHPQHLNLLMSMFHEVGFIEHKETINNLKLLEASTHYTEENKINSTRTSLASENVSSERDNMIAAEVMFESALHTKCVHPKIKWYQTEDCLILNVKIMDPQEKNCEFFRNRVIFRAVCGDKVYLADLELHDDILKEKSTCVIKSSETVITLVKQTKTIWKQLLHSKNAFVTVDFDHIEDFEELSGIKGTAVQDIFTSTFLNEEHLYPNFC